MPSRRHSSATDTSARMPSSRMRIFSSAGKLRRVICLVQRSSRAVSALFDAVPDFPFAGDSLITPISSSRARLARIRGELPGRTVGYRTLPRGPISADVGQVPTDSEGITVNSSPDVLIVGNRLIGWRDSVDGTVRCRDNAFAAVTTSPVGCTDVTNNN